MSTRTRRIATSDSEDVDILQSSFQDEDHIDISSMCEVVRVQSEISEVELRAFCKNTGSILASHDEEELEYERDSSKWPIKAVDLMVYHRLRLDEAFNSPKYAKNKLWDGISDYLKESNFNFEGKECHLKFRNMMATYKKNVERVSTYGEECLKWKWFNKFHEVLNHKPFVQQEQRPVRANKEVRACVAQKASITESHESPEPPECRKWTRSSIKMLLDLRLQTIDFFNDPRSHKVKYWRKIAKILCEKGFDVTDRDCIIKWHNLVNTYRSNVRKSQTDTIRWEWFDIMNKIYKPPLASVKPERRSAQTTYDIKEDGDQDSLVLTDDSLREDDSFHSPDVPVDDKDFIDEHWNDEVNLKDRQSRKDRKHQKAYWREKLKLQKSAERRKRREWSEKKQLKIQKINLKKQKLKLYHRLTKMLEKLSSGSRLREFLGTD